MTYQPLQVLIVTNVSLFVYLLAIRVPWRPLLRIMAWCSVVSILFPIQQLFPKVAVVAVVALLVARERVIVKAGALDVLLLNAVALVAARDNAWLAWFLNPLIVFLPNTEFVRTWVHSVIVLWPSWLVIAMLYRGSSDARLRWLITAWVQAVYVVLLVTALPSGFSAQGAWPPGERLAPFTLGFVAIHVALLAGNALLPGFFLRVRQWRDAAAESEWEIRLALWKFVTRLGAKFDVDAAAFQASRFDVGVMPVWLAVVALVACLALSLGVNFAFGQSLLASASLLMVPALIDAITQDARTKRDDALIASTANAAGTAAQSDPYREHQIDTPLLGRWSAVIALAAYAIFCVMTWYWLVKENVLTSGALPTRDRIVHFLLGALVLSIVVRLLCGVLEALHVRRDYLPVALRNVVSALVVVTFAVFYWRQAPAVHPVGGINGHQEALGGGRVYLWAGGNLTPMLTMKRAVYHERPTGTGVMREQVCVDGKQAQLVGFQVLANRYIECEWNIAPEEFSRSRFGVFEKHENGWRYKAVGAGVPLDNTALNWIELPSQAAETDDCELVAKPKPSVVCGPTNHVLLPLTGDTFDPRGSIRIERQPIYRWYLNDSRRFEYRSDSLAVNSQEWRILCLTAEVAGEVPLEPRTRLPALVLIDLFEPTSPRFRILYDKEASCGRIHIAKDYPASFYVWSDVVARRTGTPSLLLFKGR